MAPAQDSLSCQGRKAANRGLQYFEEGSIGENANGSAPESAGTRPAPRVPLLRPDRPPARAQPLEPVPEVQEAQLLRGGKDQGVKTATKERPIVMTIASVRAILGGRKTQTRRVIRPQPPDGFHENGRQLWLTHVGLGTQEEEQEANRDALAADGKRYFGQGCPYGQPGDRLWVRETLRHDPGEAWYYAADTEKIIFRSHDARVAPMLAWAHHNEDKTFCPCIHMPRWASRLTLELLAVRVERLQEISEEDAEAEGAEKAIQITPARVPRGKVGHRTGYGLSFRKGFQEGWDEINAKRGYSWKSNPWVWVLEFRKIEEA